jgi:hypothetical protein
MIDHFHVFPPLVRTARISPREVVALFEARGLRLRRRGGLHCIPVRLVASRAALARFPRLVRALYRAGEGVLGAAPTLLGDYGILAMDRGTGEAPCTSA